MTDTRLPTYSWATVWGSRSWRFFKNARPVVSHKVVSDGWDTTGPRELAL